MNATLTLARAQSELAAWLDASTKLAAGLAVSINGRSITRADAKEVRAMINYWSKIEAGFLQAADASSTADRPRSGYAVAKFG